MVTTAVLFLVVALATFTNAVDRSSRGSRYFEDRLDFISEAEGTVNGERFRVEGKGSGDGKTGLHKGKFVSIDGDLPFSWSVASSTMALECFAKYPNGLRDWRDWLKSTFPEGYTIERKVYFENDGVAKARHVVSYEGGVIRSKIRIFGEGFREDGDILRKNLKDMLPAVSYYAPDGSGARSVGYYVFPIKDSDEFQVARHETYYRKNGRRGRRVSSRRFPYHLGRSESKQYRDSNERKDHVIQEQIIEAYKLDLLRGRDVNMKVVENESEKKAE